MAELLHPEQMRAVAAACHSAVWFLQLSSGDTSTPTPRLDDAPGWAAEATYATIRTVLAGATPEQVWRDWATPKRSDGWVWGPVKDQANKRHPCLVDRYDQLSERERFKDRIFLGVITLALRGQLG